MPELDLSRPLRIHVVGAGGAGMSAIATVLVAMGHHVSGSDLKDSSALQRLRSLGVDVAVGHDASHVQGVDVVAVSTAVPAANPEIVEAERLGVAVLRRAQVLAAITATRRTVAVAGTHGKTTTSSMLALILVEAGMQPSFIIGGDITSFGSGAAWGEGDWLVVEADESDGTFLDLDPRVALVTSVEADHLDHYGSLANMEAAYATFLAGAPDARVVCADDPGAARLGAQAGAVSYGTSPGADYRMVEVTTGRDGGHFAVDHAGARLGEIRLPVARHAQRPQRVRRPGGRPRHRRPVRRRGAGHGPLRRGGQAFRVPGGAGRGDLSSTTTPICPGEVRAALAAARSGGWGRVVAVFQPHRYSRTASLWQDFADAFVDADLVVVTDVYGAGEAPRPGVNGRLVATAVEDAHPDQAVVYLPDHDGLVDYLRNSLRPGDLCLTLGAGDLTLLPDELLDARA